MLWACQVFFPCLLLLCFRQVNYSFGRFYEVDDTLLFHAVLSLRVLSAFPGMSPLPHPFKYTLNVASFLVKLYPAPVVPNCFVPVPMVPYINTYLKQCPYHAFVCLFLSTFAFPLDNYFHKFPFHSLWKDHWCLIGFSSSLKAQFPACTESDKRSPCPLACSLLSYPGHRVKKVYCVFIYLLLSTGLAQNCFFNLCCMDNKHWDLVLRMRSPLLLNPVRATPCFVIWTHRTDLE